jgi:hypothetical protein
MEEGLRAPVADPLWMIGRQSQLGAFQGEDAATPVGVALDGWASHLSRYAAGLPGTAASTPYDSRSLPLEILVERETPPRSPGRDLRAAAEAGLRFADFLDAKHVGAYAAGYRSEFALHPPAGTLDDKTSHFLAVVSGRLIDGHALRAAFRPAGTPAGTVVLPPRPAIPTADEESVRAAAVAWTEWYDSLFSAPPTEQSAWVGDRLEYAFSVSANGSAGARPGKETTLAASRYGGGRLDWYSFDVLPGETLGASADPAPDPVARRVLATPATFGGMPSPRWFELEDARVNFGRVSAGPPDLARMLLIEYASLYGNDHFVVPIELDVGSLCRIDSLVVVDNFGSRTQIVPSEQAGVRDFRMFRCSLVGSRTGDADASFLFVPPVLAQPLDGTPVEEVLLLRDEMANIVWGVERIVEAPGGFRLDRFEDYQAARRRAERAAPPEPPPPDTALSYTVQTAVPPHWIPLLPVQARQRQVRLQLREMLDDAGQPVPPRSRFLTTNPPLELYEEEVPRAGVRLTRAYHHARWIDGSTYAWLGRTKATGRGEGSSGLRFDTLSRQS